MDKELQEWIAGLLDGTKGRNFWIGYDTAELIADLKADGEEFGAEVLCRVYYEKVEGAVVFHDYVLEAAAEAGEESYLTLPLSEALAIFEAQYRAPS